VASLAGGYDVVWDRAWWVAFAKVRGGEGDCAFGVPGGPAVDFCASALGFNAAVEPALPATLATALRADEPDVG